MTVLEFIFNTMLMIIISFIVIGAIGTIWNNDQLRKENKQLKEDMRKLKIKKMKKEKESKK